MAAVVGIKQSLTSNSFEEPEGGTSIKSKVCRALRCDDAGRCLTHQATHQAFASRTFRGSSTPPTDAL
jgi:hypothetical protein